MAEELAHDANEELDGTTTDSPVVTGSGFNSSPTSGTYITQSHNFLWPLLPLLPNLSSPISPLDVMHYDVDATLSPHDFMYEDNVISSDDC